MCSWVCGSDPRSELLPPTAIPNTYAERTSKVSRWYTPDWASQMASPASEYVRSDCVRGRNSIGPGRRPNRAPLHVEFYSHFGLEESNLTFVAYRFRYSSSLLILGRAEGVGRALRPGRLDIPNWEESAAGTEKMAGNPAASAQFLVVIGLTWGFHRRGIKTPSGRGRDAEIP
jgi:hypothetical protein